MKPKFTFLRRGTLSLVALALPAFSQSLWAEPITWSNTGTNFNAGPSWVGGIAPGARNTATFTGTRVTNPVLGAPATVRGLAFADAAASGYAISGGTLTLGSAGINAGAVTGGTNSIASNLVFGAGQTWSAGAGSTLAFTTGTFTRSPGTTLNVQGGGTISSSMTGLALTNGIVGPWATAGSGSGIRYVTLSGGNLIPYTAATVNANWLGTMNNGTTNYDVTAGSNTTFGASNRTANTVRYLGGADTLTLGNLNSGAQLITNGVINAGTGTLNLVNGTGSLAGAGLAAGSANEVVLNAANAAINVSSRVLNNGANASGVTIVGPNLVTLSGVNTYTGATTVNDGTLLVSGTGSINTSSGITVNATGAKYLHTSSVASTVALSLLHGTLDGTGTVGAVTVANNPASVITNGDGGTAPLTLGSLTFNGTANVNVNKGASTPLVVSGTLATTPVNGQVNINVPGVLGNGVIDLISYGTLSGSIADFTIVTPGLGARQSAAPFLNGNNIAVQISGETIVWTGANSDLWETSAAGDHNGAPNWARKTAQSATNFWAGDVVEFNDTYNLGSGNVPVTQNWIVLFDNVSPATTSFNNSSVSFIIDSYNNGITSGSLIKNGTATTTLLGPHTYTGPTTINEGTLKLGNESTFDGTIANTSSVTNNGILHYQWYADRTAPYPISGSGSLIKQGSATLTLTGANTSTGTTNILEGAITVTGGGGIGSGTANVAAGANLNINKTYATTQQVNGAGTITANGGTNTISGDFSGFNGIYRHAYGTASTVIVSTASTSAAAAYEITVGTASDQGIITNVTTGDNTFKLGSLSGIATTRVRNGGSVTGNTTFEIGALGTSTEFAGSIGGGGGTVGLTKIGAGTLTLTGPNIYNGPTLVNAGTLAFSTTPQTLGNSAFTVANNASLRVKTAAAGSTLLTTNSLALGSGGSANLTFDFNTLNPTASQISTGALTVNGPVSLSFLNANALVTGTYKLIDYTSLAGTGSFPGGSFSIGNRAVATIVNNTLDTSIDLNVTADSTKWTGLDSGNWVAGTTGPNKNWKLVTANTAVDYLNGDTVLFDDSATGTTSVTIPVDNVSPVSTTFNNTTKAYSISGAFGIASGSLTKNGTNNVTLANPNPYTGVTTINAGTLQLGNGSADGTIANTASVVNNGTLAYNWIGNNTAAYPISGTGNVTKTGTGIATLTGNNTYSGGTSITGGQLTLAGAGTLGTGTIAVGGGTSLDINKNLALTNTVTGAGIIANTGNTAVTGDFSGFTGTFIHNSDAVSVSFSSANATSQNAAYHIASVQAASQGMLAGMAGDYTLRMGSLSGVANSLFRGGNTVSGITTLEIGNLGTNTEFAGSINNGATKTIAVSKVGAGTLTLSGASAYTGTTLVFGGTLNVTGSLASGSVVTVTAGATLSGTGTVAGTVIAGGTVAPGTSIGTLTTGSATLTGTLAIELDGAAGDKLLSTGGINVTGADLTVTPLAGGFAGSYVIAEGTSITGPFNSVPAGYSVNIVAGGAGQQAILTSTGGGYSSWAAANAGGGTIGQDHDMDGVENGVEYFMNAAAGFTANPKIVGGTITWPNGGNISASKYGTEYVVQTSPNLGTWTNVPAGSLTSNTNGPGGALTYTLPTGAGKIFVRLSVIPN